MTKEEQGAEEGGEDVWCDAMKGLPDGVRNGVGPWGGGGRAPCQSGGDLICGESGAICKGTEDGGEWPRRLWREEVIEQGVVDMGGGSGIREGGETWGKSSQGQLLYGPYRPRGAEARRDLQWAALAALMALK